MSRYFGCVDCNGKVHRGICPKVRKIREDHRQEVHANGEMTYEERIMAGTLMLNWREPDIIVGVVTGEEVRRESAELWLYERAVLEDDDDGDIEFEEGV